MTDNIKTQIEKEKKIKILKSVIEPTRFNNLSLYAEDNNLDLLDVLTKYFGALDIFNELKKIVNDLFGYREETEEGEREDLTWFKEQIDIYEDKMVRLEKNKMLRDAEYIAQRNEYLGILNSLSVELARREAE